LDLQILFLDNNHIGGCTTGDFLLDCSQDPLFQGGKTCRITTCILFDDAACQIWGWFRSPTGKSKEAQEQKQETICWTA
jgi:hypothetical protein